MTSTGHDAIISGRSYRVMQVAGDRPSDLADFVGNTELLIEADEDQHQVIGVGAYSSEGVRFYEKDVEMDGKDVRTWIISPSSDGEFTAEHVAAF